MRMWHGMIALAALLLLVGCGGEPVEVTRIVDREVPVTVEVTRVVAQVETVEVAVEVPVEATRLVEVTRVVEVVATPEAASTAVSATPTAEIAPTDTPAGGVYTVETGDNLTIIATKTDTAVDDILAANGLTRDSVLTVGQTLTIPGWDGVVREVAAAPPAPPAATTAPAATEAAPPAAAQNLLPNPSFEGDWYFYLYNELQVPEGWQLATDEGPNTLEPGAGGLFNRPEVRVVPAPDLPPAEQALFVIEGNKTVKAFKGGAPTSFSLFTDVALPPGNYRMTVRFFADTVAAYDGGQKTYASNPLAAEVRILVDNGGMAWQGVQSGQRNTVTFDFTVSEARTVRVGASFRNRFVMANNGWFLDDWSLVALP